MHAHSCICTGSGQARLFPSRREASRPYSRPWTPPVHPGPPSPPPLRPTTAPPTPRAPAFGPNNTSSSGNNRAAPTCNTQGYRWLQMATGGYRWLQGYSHLRMRRMREATGRPCRLRPRRGMGGAPSAPSRRGGGNQRGAPGRRAGAARHRRCASASAPLPPAARRRPLADAPASAAESAEESVGRGAAAERASHRRSR